MAVKLYLLQCSCSYKRWSDGSDLHDLVQVNTCRSCGGGPKFKCPSCGMLIKAKKINQLAEPKPEDTRL